jgi:hypothetical protein
MSISMIGLDTAKSVFQVHAVDQPGEMEIRRKLRRSELIALFERFCPVSRQAGHSETAEPVLSCGLHDGESNVPLSVFLKRVFLKMWAKWALCPGVWLAILTVARRLEALLKIEWDPDLGIKTIDAERHGGKWVVRAGGAATRVARRKALWNNCIVLLRRTRVGHAG